MMVVVVVVVVVVVLIVVVVALVTVLELQHSFGRRRRLVATPCHQSTTEGAWAMARHMLCIRGVRFPPSQYRPSARGVKVHGPCPWHGAGSPRCPLPAYSVGRQRGG